MARMKKKKAAKPSTGMATFSGVVVDPFNLNPDDVCIEDIAHHLAMICRFNGACKHHYSVATHSVNVAAFVAFREGSPEEVYAAMMHDTAEAYLGDVIRPLKNHPELGYLYEKAENKVMAVLSEKFGFLWPKPESVVYADDYLCWLEASKIIKGGGKNWENYESIGLPLLAKHDNWSERGWRKALTLEAAEMAFMGCYRNAKRRCGG